jgi:hypothetical protein
MDTDPEAAAAAARGAAIPAGAGAEGAEGEPIVFGPFTAERPELLVVAAFVGALLVARILKKITE